MQMWGDIGVMGSHVAAPWEQLEVWCFAQGHLKQCPGGELAPFQLPVHAQYWGLEPATLRFPKPIPYGLSLLFWRLIH